MNLSAALFLVAFPAIAWVWWRARRQTVRLLFLFATSLVLYAYVSAAGLPVLLAVIATTYLAGVAMARWDRHADAVAVVAVTALVAELALFKYAAFIDAQLPPGLGGLPVLLVPLGISFYTFEAIAYVIDVKRGMVDAERSPLHVGLFIAFFPHLIAGPIMRADDLIPQFKRLPVWDAARVTSGLQLFVEGLAKKRLIADPMAMVADPVFADPASVSTGSAWLGLLAYTVRIYADFSGYTDMARGLARMLGFEMPINFRAPYAAHSITDFWQRWHITLSSWLRDYVWVPLGGLRHGRVHRYTPVFLTMLVAGIWHGAGWTFVAWGAYHGAWLALERRWAWADRVPRWLAAAVTLFIVVNGFVLFRAASFDAAGALLAAMYAPRSGWSLPTPDAVLTLLAFSLVVGAMVIQRLRAHAFDALRLPRTASGIAYGLAAVAALVVASTPTPFIYFQF